MSSFWTHVVLLAGAALLSACANPTHRADEFANHSGFHKEIVLGTGFRHVVYRNSAANTGGALHVYIEGDGLPYRGRDTVSTDPTPHNLLMLRLMALDALPSIYLGRPCYFALYRDRGCGPPFWTLRRYAPEVVDSMEAALRSESRRVGTTAIEIYGHSGGGTLAILLAQRVASVSRVVTIGANLDTAAWCRLHGYSPLIGSMSPLVTAPARADLNVLHLVGAEDTNTPPLLVQSAAQARGGETVRIVPGFGHVCCWESVWPDIVH
jgi:pimeloyl-ACP methyl ester carboxylesterase